MRELNDPHAGDDHVVVQRLRSYIQALQRLALEPATLPSVPARTASEQRGQSEDHGSSRSRSSAWAERARVVGYPERFAQEALGHKSAAVHRAYAKKAKVKIPSLEEYEKKIVPLAMAVNR